MTLPLCAEPVPGTQPGYCNLTEHHDGPHYSVTTNTEWRTW